jgi:NAD(P)H dehydrogenase (quinone)
MNVTVTGASGRVGGRIVGACAARGFNVVAVSRTDPNRDEPNVRWFSADYGDAGALPAAFDDADVAVVVSSDGEAHEVLAHHYHLAEAISGAGVRRVVYLSALDASAQSPFCYAVTHARTEQRLASVCTDTAFVRASLFTEFFALWILGASTELRLPMNDGRVSLVSRIDVADSMVGLIDSDVVGTVRVTGPQSLGLRELAGLSGELLGRVIQPVDIPLREFRATLVDQFNPWWSYAFASMFESIQLNQWSDVSSAVHEIVQREPTSALTALRRMLT